MATKTSGLSEAQVIAYYHSYFAAPVALPPPPSSGDDSTRAAGGLSPGTKRKRQTKAATSAPGKKAVKERLSTASPRVQFSVDLIALQNEDGRFSSRVSPSTSSSATDAAPSPPTNHVDSSSLPMDDDIDLGADGDEDEDEDDEERDQLRSSPLAAASKTKGTTSKATSGDEAGKATKAQKGKGKKVEAVSTLSASATPTKSTPRGRKKKEEPTKPTPSPSIIPPTLPPVEVTPKAKSKKGKAAATAGPSTFNTSTPQPAKTKRSTLSQVITARSTSPDNEYNTDTDLDHDLIETMVTPSGPRLSPSSRDESSAGEAVTVSVQTKGRKKRTTKRKSGVDGLTSAIGGGSSAPSTPVGQADGLVWPGQKAKSAKKGRTKPGWVVNTPVPSA